MARYSKISNLNLSLIGFSENARTFIEKGTEISTQQNKLYRTETRLTEGGGGSSDLGVNFWGYSSDSSESVSEQFELDNVFGQFFYPPLLSLVDDLIYEAESSIDLGGDLQKARIKYSSIPKGMFDFSKASKGLIRPVEYYCIELDKIVKADDVYNEKVGGIKTFFIKNGKDVLVCEPRQEGTTEMLKTFPNKLKKSYLGKLNLYVPENILGEKVTKMGSKRLRFTSTEKKVYAYRERMGGGVAPFVDLYINNSGYHGTTSSGRFLKALPSLMIAKLLEQAGVRTRIWSGEWSTYYNSKRNAYVQNSLIKEYGEPLDLNKIGVIVADSRYFRGLGSNAKFGYFYDLQNFWKQKDNSLPTLTDLNWGSSSPMSEEEARNFMKYVRNAYYEYDKLGLVKPTQASKNLMLYLTSPFDGSEVWFEFKDKDGKTYEPSEINSRISGGAISYFTNDGTVVFQSFKDWAKDRVVESFNRNLDYISLMLSKNPKGVISRVRNRELESNLEKGESSDEATENADKYLSETLIGDVFKNLDYTNNDEKNPNILQKTYMSSQSEVQDGEELRRNLILMINEQIKTPRYKSTQ